MPNPVPLATKEEEERRAWVTAHHEVVRLVKDCFGDRFSNNEIFDRLKISRRTGYRALGNDDRIGKAAGRKPKILDATIREMIEYIECGGCRDVGNVWKHLAQKFAPDCNPKTVQDAVKKSGFKNYNNQVKLSPLLNETLPDDGPGPLDEDDIQHDLSQSRPDRGAQQHGYPVSQSPALHDNEQQQQHNSMQHSQSSVIDPAFQQMQSTHDMLRHAINEAEPHYLRSCLNEVIARHPETTNTVFMYFGSWPYAMQPTQTHAPTPSVPHHLFANQPPGMTFEDHNSQRKRIATCRRCGQDFDRAENTMKTRGCAYHKGSPQKISPETPGTIEESPEAFIWSCCGGNGFVRGCSRAMHTTKKKRTYSKKRNASDAGLDDDLLDEDGPTDLGAALTEVNSSANAGQGLSTRINPVATETQQDGPAVNEPSASQASPGTAQTEAYGANGKFDSAKNLGDGREDRTVSQRGSEDEVATHENHLQNLVGN